jgi:acetoin utilization protein AcuB
MFISTSMTSKVITIGPEDSIIHANDLMAENRIRHLPVIDGDNMILGIVSDRDIRSAMPGGISQESDCKEECERFSKLQVKNIMTINPLTVTSFHTIQDALLMIQKAKVGAFPVVDDRNRLVGIISVRDLLRSFINVLGIGEPGTLLCILVEEKIGQMKKIVDAITEENISFGSILVARYWDEGKRAVFPYLLTQNVSKIKKKLVTLGYTLLDPMDWYLDKLPKHESS